MTTREVSAAYIDKSYQVSGTTLSTLPLSPQPGCPSGSQSLASVSNQSASLCLLALAQYPAPLLLFPSPLHAQSLTLAAGSVGCSLVPRGAHAQEAAWRVLAAPTVTRWRHAVALVHVCGHKQGGWGRGRHSASSPPPDGLAGSGGPGTAGAESSWGRGQAEAGARGSRGARSRFKAAAELQR